MIDERSIDQFWYFALELCIDFYYIQIKYFCFVRMNAIVLKYKFTYEDTNKFKY